MLKQEPLYQTPKVVLPKNTISGIFFALFVLISAVIIFCAGGYLGQKLYQPKVITRYQVNSVDRVVEKVVYTPVDRVVETIVYEPVEKIVYEQIEKPVIKEVEVLKPLALFSSLGDLKEWLANTSVVEIAFNIVDQDSNTVKPYDCDDYARRLQSKALDDGYIVSMEIIRAPEYNSLFKENKLPAGAIHAINSAVIGNEVYYIEPQTNETVLAAFID